MALVVPFPATQPPGYEWFDDEPTFDAARHLQLEMPTERVMLAELGYSADKICTKATDFAVSSPFRVLSDAGATVLLGSCTSWCCTHHGGRAHHHGERLRSERHLDR